MFIPRGGGYYRGKIRVAYTGNALVEFNDPDMNTIEAALVDCADMLKPLILQSDLE